MLGHGDVEFDDLGFNVELLCCLERVLHCVSQSGEDDLCAFLLGETSNAKAKRGVIEHSGHQQSLTFKQSHGSSDRGQRRDVTLPNQ